MGGGDVDFFEVLVVEGAADLFDDRGAAAGLKVGRHRVGECEGGSDLAGEWAGFLHEAGEFDFHLLLIECEADDFAALVQDHFLLVRIIEGQVGDDDARLILGNAPVASSAKESRGHLTACGVSTGVRWRKPPLRS